VNVLETTDLAVNQVLALSRPVQAASHLDVAREILGQCRERLLVFGMMTVAIPVLVAVAMAIGFDGPELLERLRRRQHSGYRVHRHLRWYGQAAEAQAHFGSGARFPRVTAAEDDVFHLLAAQALGALLAQDPRDGVGDVALAAAVRPDDRGDAAVEGKLRPI
jgi:hypothetical protein